VSRPAATFENDLHLRALVPGDRSAARNLWEERFDDPVSFVDWFFLERYRPETSAGLFLDGQLVSVIHGCPMPLMIRGKETMAMMVSGVATARGFERRGYMHQVMGKIAELARKKGCAILFHHPESFRTYQSLSQLAGCDCIFAKGREEAAPVEKEPSLEELMDCYHRALLPYSGWVWRDEATFQSRLADYRACGGRIVSLYREGKLIAYAVHLEDGSVPEALAAEKGDYPELLRLLPKDSQVKLPPDVPVNGNREERNAYGAADVPALLKQFVGHSDIILQVEDPLTEENCGTFDGLGNRIAGRPDVCLTSGELVQGILGYRAIPSLFEERVCYCIEEY